MVIIKIHYISFGCKGKLYETEYLKGAFSSEGFTTADSEDNADIFVINTCTVTAESDKKLKKTVKHIKNRFPDAITLLTGCYVQAFPEEARNTGADILVGNRSKNHIVQLVREYLSDRKKSEEIADIAHSRNFEPMTLTSLESKTRAFLKIQDGCDRYCSYCIIPTARGRCCSKPPEDIRNEAKLLAQKGYKEIVLVGINLSFYGKEYSLTLSDAIEIVGETDGIERIRLGSLEPEMITDDDIKRMSAQKKLCPQFHLSLQSGCDKTLKAMNRHYTADEYRTLVGKLRKSFENCAITTDIMAGFPGETDEDFLESCRFVEEIGFSDAHIFAYSRRYGTKAYSMDNQVDENVKKQRAKRLSEITINSQKRYLSRQVGRIVPVLFERESSPDFHNGHSPEYMFIKVPKKSCEKSLRNMIFYVRILEIENNCAVGEIISPDEL